MLDFLIRHQTDVMLALASICAMTTFFVFLTDSLEKGRKRALMIIEIGGMLLSLFEMFSYLCRGEISVVAYWMVRIGNFMTFAMMPVLLVGLTYYLQDLLKNDVGLKKPPRRLKAIYILAAAGEILIIGNLFGKYYYVIDEQNTYHRSWAFMICYIIPFVILAILLTVIIQYYKRISKGIRLSLLLFVITPFAGSCIQFFIYGLSITDIFIVATCVMLYVFVLIDLNRSKDVSVRAVAASEAKSAFLSNMSHEIRTPINAVLGMNEMILRECEDENILEYASTIKTAGSTLLGLINDILDFSKIEAGKMEIIPVEYDLSSVINDLVIMTRTRADVKGLEVKVDIDKDTPKILFGDEVRIKQVITNILTNAVKYTEKGSVTFTLNYEKLEPEAKKINKPETEDLNSDKSEPEDDIINLKISVKDTGIGIKEEDMSKLFSQFDRIEEERNRNVEGTGLGMSITKKLLEMMDSSLEVDSVYGEGSDFHFVIRQKVIKWEPIGDYEASYKASVSTRVKYKEKFTAPDAVVLIIDDTVTNLDVFKNLLKRTKVQIDTGVSGEECLKMSAEKKYDIVFLDHMMPDKDGIETLHEMRDMPDNPNIKTPAVCLTANAISGAREKYLSEGFDDYLTKPIEADKLEEMLIRYIPEEKVILSGNAGKQTTAETYADEEPEEEKTLPDWLLNCKEVDTELGVINCGGVEGYLSVLTGFHSSINDMADEIENFYNNDDIKNYTIKVHALKSSARIIGAIELSEKARLLEEAGHEEYIDYIKAETAELLRHYRSYKEILSPIAEKSESLPDIPPEMLADAYAGLTEFTEIQDYELARMVTESLKEYKLPDADEDRFKRINSKLAKMDWDGIKEILNEAR